MFSNYGTFVVALTFLLQRYHVEAMVNDKTIVETEAGYLRGLYVHTPEVCYFSYKGIPYAEPPVGVLRFRSPVPKKNWEGCRDATKHGSFCANKFGFFGLNQTAGGSEDCLFLNVYTPKLKGKRAVMFFIHGGGLVSGSGDDLVYGPEPLVREDIVIVTINYRLSAFGFLSTGDVDASGNQGLKDMVLALKWVHNNIENFGGDPERVTLMGGSSSGAVAVNFMMLSDQTEGLYHQAILQSSSAFLPAHFQLDPKKSSDTLAKQLGLRPNSHESLVDCLRHVDYQKILDVEQPLGQMEAPYGLRPFNFTFAIEPKPIRHSHHSSSGEEADDRVVKKSPIEVFRSGKYKKVPIMIGNGNNEGMTSSRLLEKPGVLDYYNSHPEFLVPTSFNLEPNSCKMTETIEKFKHLYFNGKCQNIEDWHTFYGDQMFKFPLDRAVRYFAESSDEPIYYYEFSFDGSLNFFKKLNGLQRYKGANVGDELLYLFSTRLPGYEPDCDSTLIRNRMTRMWSNFAKYGNPTPKKDKLITTLWHPYSKDNQNIFEINLKLNNRQQHARLNTLSELQKELTGDY